MIKWNFTKFHVSPDGTEVQRVAPQSSAKSLEPQIQAWLPKGTGTGRSTAPTAPPATAP